MQREKTHAEAHGISEVLALFARTLFGRLVRTARRLGTDDGEAGAITFVQRFGSALQLNVHFHLLCAEGVFTNDGTFVPTPPPDDLDVQRLLETFLHRLRALLQRRGLEPLDALPDDALEVLQLQSSRLRLPNAAHPLRRRLCLTPRCARPSPPCPSP